MQSCDTIHSESYDASSYILASLTCAPCVLYFIILKVAYKVQIKVSRGALAIIHQSRAFNWKKKKIHSEWLDNATESKNLIELPSSLFYRGVENNVVIQLRPPHLHIYIQADRSARSTRGNEGVAAGARGGP